MIKFNTLRTIIEDMLLVIRGSKITESETISRRQLEDWVHQYRALLIARDLDKGYYPNPDYIQETTLNITGSTSLKSSTALPRVIDRNYKSGLTFIGKVDGTEIQMVPEHRSVWQQYKRYTSEDTLWYLNSDSGIVTITNPGDLSIIKVRGIFENPTEIGSFTLDTRYPVPNNIVPVIKEMILSKELKIEATAPSDNKNDDDNGLSNNNEKQYRI